MNEIVSFFAKISNARKQFAISEKLFGKYAEAEQHLERIELFDFDHPNHPFQCLINDPKDLISAPHGAKINIIVNSEHRGPEIDWLARQLKEGVVYLTAKVVAIESFSCEFLFQKTGEGWEKLDPESDAFQQIAGELKILQALKK